MLHRWKASWTSCNPDEGGEKPDTFCGFPIRFHQIRAQSRQRNVINIMDDASDGAAEMDIDDDSWVIMVASFTDAMRKLVRQRSIRITGRPTNGNPIPLLATVDHVSTLRPVLISRYRTDHRMHRGYALRQTTTIHDDYHTKQRAVLIDKQEMAALSESREPNMDDFRCYARCWSWTWRNND